MDKYNVKITLRPLKTDYGRGSRIFYTAFDAISAEQAEDFGRQYVEGFLLDGIKVETKATLCAK